MGNVADTATQTHQELPAAGALTAGVTVREVLETPALAGATLLAGANGLDRVVRRLNVMEVPDVLPWVKAHELLLTTGYPVRATPDGVAAFLAALDDRGLGAVRGQTQPHPGGRAADPAPGRRRVRRHPQPGPDRGPQPAGGVARTQRGGAPHARDDRARGRRVERAGVRDGRRLGRSGPGHHR